MAPGKVEYGAATEMAAQVLSAVSSDPTAMAAMMSGPGNSSRWLNLDVPAVKKAAKLPKVGSVLRLSQRVVWRCQVSLDLMPWHSSTLTEGCLIDCQATRTDHCALACFLHTHGTICSPAVWSWPCPADPPPASITRLAPCVPTLPHLYLPPRSSNWTLSTGHGTRPSSPTTTQRPARPPSQSAPPAAGAALEATSCGRPTPARRSAS